MKRITIFIMLVALLAIPAGAKSVRKKSVKRPSLTGQLTGTRADLSKGIEAYNNENFVTAESLFKSYVKKYPDDAYGWAYLAALKSDLDQPNEALEAIERARECKIDEKDTYMLNWMHYTRSTIHLQLNDTISAIDDLNMALRFDDKDVDCYVRRGNLYKKLRRYDEAMVDYGTIVQLNPKEVEGYLGIGTVSGSLKKRKDAIKAYTMAIKLEPELADPYAMRAVEYYNDWDYKKAAKDIIDALEREKDNARALWLLQYLKRDAPEELEKELKNKAKKTKDASWLDLLN